jgi:hypothetical protein
VTPAILIPILYGLILLIAGLVEIWALYHQEALAPMGELIERIMHHRMTRIAVVFVWWWLGWHFVVA